MLPENKNKGLEFDKANLKEIYLAGGCFWGVDAYIERIIGVYSTESGYANGFENKPISYEELCKGHTGFAETVKVLYDSTKISFEDLLKEFFKIIDPTTLNRQAGDIGTQYRTGIYYVNDTQKHIAENFIKEQQPNYIFPIVTEVLPIESYYRAEEYHQDYLEKNPNGYCHINF
ncbi:MAG: peptide-methionine (S)-S-oxide reductase MsrA [Defluviitaleaceae bacterium]|nr:peptide-methionine (S)-S-oxide reductase MsrA [Defluviitaleaceae bacterium]